MNAVVLGGTHDHIKLIKILKNRGYTVYLIDYYDNPIAGEYADHHIKGSTLDTDFVIEKCKEIDAQLCLAFCIDQALLTMAYVSEKLGLPCYITYQRALELTNKVYMKQIMAASGIPTSKFLILEEGKDDHDDIGKLSFPLVIKPADANSSKGISKIERTDELKSAIKAAYGFSRSNKVIIEEFVQGNEYSADYLILNGKPQLLLITKYYKSKIHQDKFIITQSISPGDLSADELSELGNVAARIGESFGISNGPLFIQFLQTDKGVNIVEFSSRIGGGSKHHFLYYKTGFDYLECLVDLTLGKSPEIVLKEDNRWLGINYVYADKGVFATHKGLDELKANGGVSDYFLYKAPGSQVTGSTSSVDRILGLLVEADSFEELVMKTRMVDSNMMILNEENEDIMIHNLYF